MAALAQPLTSESSTITISGGTLTVGAVLSIEHELLNVTQVLTSTQGRIKRGVSGTVSAAHGRGVPVTPQTDATAALSSSTGPGQVLLQTQAASNSWPTFLNCFTTDYDKYVIEMQNLVITSQDDVAFQVSKDGGTTWETNATSTYRSVMTSAPSNAAGLSYDPANNGVVGYIAKSVVDDLSGTLQLFDPLGARASSASCRRFVFTGAWKGAGNGDGGITWGEWTDGAGSVASSPYTAVRIRLGTAGNFFASGVARLYGVTK